jgi:alpha-tubulin suppressor-like RCC1 family protein
MRRSVVGRVLAGWLLLMGLVVGLTASAEATAAQSAGEPAVVPGGVCVSPGPHGFSDVPSNSYYNLAVGWLVEAGITSGVAPGKYAPSATVTRGQMAVFLWAAAGSPQPAGGHSFTDVKPGVYYEQAVIWLVAEGITSGVAPGKFAPSATVTRAQMAVFLWAAAGSPTVEGTHDFTDIKAGVYYEKAVTWLVGEGITSGVAPGKYGPTQPVTRAQMAVFLWKTSCAKAQTFSTPALPEGNDRFVDSIVRDLLARTPTEAELTDWVSQLDNATLTRQHLATNLAGRDEFLGLIVDDVFLAVLDRLPTDPERTTGLTQVSTDGGASGLLVDLVASSEFFEMAGSTDSGFIYTAGQRLLKRDLTSEEATPFITGLSDTTMSRTDVATDLAGGVEGSRVRAKMWSEKLLSRVPTDPELALWGGQLQASGDLSLVATIAGGDDYLLLAQERITKSTLTTAPGTMVVSGPQVVSAVYADNGTGTVVLAAGVIPPAVGGHLVVSNETNPTAGGISRATALTPGPGGQTTVEVVAAGLADAFASGEAIDTTEMVEPELVPAGAGRPSGQNTPSSDCEREMAVAKVKPSVGVDVKNDSSLEWKLNDFDARIAARVTPKMAVTITGMTLSAECSKELWSKQWDAPIQAGPVTIPGYFKVGSELKVKAQVTAFDLTGSMSLPCTIGVKATKNSFENITGCSRMKTSLTFTPEVEATATLSADLEVGYFLGIDKGGWAKANIGMTTGLEAGIEAEARLVQNPGWEVDAYLDANLNLEGGLGKWDLDHNIANKRLKTWPIASGTIDNGTAGKGIPDGGTYHPSEESIEPPLSPDAPAAIAAGYEQTCALKQNSTVVCWGENYNGEVGDGTDIDRHTPTAVVGLSSVTAIAANTCALTEDRTVSCWGLNQYGQAGDGTTLNRYTPARVPGLTDVTNVGETRGGGHSCAVKQNGTVSCWGLNDNGQLGDGTTTQRLTPTTVAGLTNVADISAGGRHTCAAKQDGTVSCWGDNFLGQLGDGTGTEQHTPTAVPGLTDVTAINTGANHTCALKRDRTVSCWGFNYNGQVGDGTTTQRYLPKPVAGLTDVAEISLGANHSCALKLNSQVACWGWNGDGQLGDETNTRRLTPTLVASLTEVMTVTANGSHTCALTQDRVVSCWGDNENGQLGDGTTTDRYSPTPVVGL